MTIPSKRNFSIYAFKIPTFSGKTTRVARYSNGVVKKQRNGYPKYEEVAREQGQVKTDSFRPHEYVDYFLPIKMNHAGRTE